MAKSKATQLVDHMLEQKVLTKDQVKKVTEEQQKHGHSFLETINDLELVEGDVLLEAVAKELNLPAIHTAKCKISSDTLALLPKKVAFTHQVLPLSKVGDVLTIAVCDPLNMNVLDDVERVTGLHVQPVISTKREIRESVDAQYSEDTSKAIKDVMKDMEFMEMSVVRDEPDSETTDVEELMNLTQEEPVVRLTEHILGEGIRRKSSDIFVEPQERNLVIRYRVDGILREGPRPPQTMHQGIVSRIKILSNLDIAERRLPQDGRFKMKFQTRLVDFRVSTIPTYLGEKVCLRVLDPTRAQVDIKGLGFGKRDTKVIEEAASKPHGMILTCGPTGSGKTTTLYAILNQLNNIETNLVTIEDPVEYAVNGINQVNTRADVGLTFASALRSILRQDPDVILVGEVRDSETADTAVKAALTGHLVLSTLHTNTAVGAITRLANLGVEPFLLTSTIIMTASQRLIRKVCEECAQKYKPSAEVKKMLGMDASDGITFSKGKGCEHCLGTGYNGRVCIVELLPMSPSVKDLIIKHANEDKIKAVARKEGMVTLRENAILKLREGVTTVDEVLRMTMPDVDLKKEHA